MKRIMLLAIVIVMLMFVCSVTKGYYGYSSVRYRVRWSPYVHGLVRGDVRWSPYVHGLVDDDVYYNPYAFKYGHSGLISERYYRSYYYPVCQVSAQPEVFGHRARTRQTKRRVVKVNNGRQVISNYLTANGIKFKVVDGCSVSNVDFLLTDMNIILRYQDPTEAQCFENLPEDNYKRILYEKYKQRSADRFKEFPVYMIKAANEKDILTGLMLCL